MATAALASFQPVTILQERRHRGPRRRATPSLDVMRRADSRGTPLFLCDLVQLTGLSKSTLLKEIRSGTLKARPWKPGARMLWIDFDEAQRYLRTLGII